MDKRPLLVVAVAGLIGIWLVRSCGGPGGGVADDESQPRPPGRAPGATSQPNQPGQPNQPSEPTEPAVDAAALLTRAHTAAARSSSVHVQGNAEIGTVDVAYDLSLTRDGTATGRVSRLGALGVEVIRIGDTCYLRDGSSYTRTCAFPMPDGQPPLDLRSLTDFGALMSEFAPERMGEVEAGSTRRVGGVETVELAGRDGVVLRVPLESESQDARPVELDRPGGSVEFSEWDEPVTAAAPTNVTG